MEAQNQLTLQIVTDIADVTREGEAHVVDFIVLQLNDVYEAAPVEGGRLGGLARAATVQRRLAEENPRLLSVMIGDFLNPSAISAVTGDGGSHMIEALNAMGLTHATMGNHEFDVSESDLLLRIEESRFKWIVSNVMNAAGEPFKHVAKHEVVTFTNDAGDAVRVALIGVCTDMVKKPWIRYQNVIESAREQVAELADKADVFVAMTHLTIGEDKELGTKVPRLDVLMGGHEHEAATAIVGDDNTPIFKADSNARSVCVHRFRFDTQTRGARLHTTLLPVDDSIPEEPATAAVVKRWETMTYDTLRAQGTDPAAVVGRTAEPLRGYEAEVRSGPTNLTRLICEKFLAEVPDADAIVFASGFIRIDGVIPPGDILYFDVVRIFPLGGKLSVLSMYGAFLSGYLDYCMSLKGTGSYLQLAGIARGANGWEIKGEPVVAGKQYKIVNAEVPAAQLAYPPFKGSGTTKLYDTRDIRTILADSLRRDMAAAGASGR